MAFVNLFPVQMPLFRAQFTLISQKFAFIITIVYYSQLELLIREHERVKQLIEISNLTKKYGTHEAVKDLSFRVEKGQIYGLLGPNGAGKSTTMNILTGYLCATEGTVTINGYDIFKEPEKAKEHIGYLPELPPLYQDMTVYEYMKFVAELKKIKKEDRETMIQEAMEMTGVADVSKRLIKNLSKGYRQRVGFAQAVLGYPEIIILDEPTVGLDPKQIIEIRDLIKKLGENHTIILSSHILSEVSAVCDQILIMSKGHLVANDTPENLAKMLKGNHSISLLVKGSESAAKAVLDQTEKIETYTVSVKPDSSLCQAVVDLSEHSEADIDEVEETLFYAFAEAKLPIHEMQTTHASLEDVFLELTSTDFVPEESTSEAEPETSSDTAAEEKTEEVNENAGNL